MRFEAGSKFAGYTVVSRLGRGGMATVYLARESGIDRLVALKILPEQLVDDAQFSTRFEQEARLIGSLDHPNIIPLYRYGITDDVPWMALRYVDGGDFAVRLAARPLPVPTGLSMLQGVAAALDYAHRKGVIHRDLKPQNILLTGEGAVYLADFGVAKMLEGANGANTAAGEVLGSPPYMSPEQAQGLQLGPYTDVYALAVICYQWLTGSLPFDADTPHAILIKHIMEPLPTDSLGLLSPNVASVLERGLAKRPEQRFQSATALMAELEQALYSVATVAVGMPAQTMSAPNKLTQPASTKRSAAPAAAALVTPSKRRGMWIGFSALVLAAAVAAYASWRHTAVSLPNRQTLASTSVPIPTPAHSEPVKRADQSQLPTGPEKLRRPIVRREPPLALVVSGREGAHPVMPARSTTPSPLAPVEGYPLKVAHRAMPVTMQAMLPKQEAKELEPLVPNQVSTARRASVAMGEPAIAAPVETSPGATPSQKGINIRLACGTGAKADSNANEEYLPSWNPRANQSVCVSKRRFPMLWGAESVRADTNAMNEPILKFAYKPDAARRLAGLALDGPQRRLAVVLNGKILGSALIRATAQGGEIDVSGLGQGQARMLAKRFQAVLGGNQIQRPEHSAFGARPGPRKWPRCRKPTGRNCY